MPQRSRKHTRIWSRRPPAQRRRCSLDDYRNPGDIRSDSVRLRDRRASGQRRHRRVGLPGLVRPRQRRRRARGGSVVSCHGSDRTHRSDHRSGGPVVLIYRFDVGAVLGVIKTGKTTFTAGSITVFIAIANAVAVRPGALGTLTKMHRAPRRSPRRPWRRSRLMLI